LGALVLVACSCSCGSRLHELDAETKFNAGNDVGFVAADEPAPNTRDEEPLPVLGNCVGTSLEQGVLPVRRLTVGSDGGDANGDSDWPDISGDGRFVVLSSAARNLDSSQRSGIFLLDRLDDSFTFVASPGWPAISADGRSVMFTSYASDLVEGDENDMPDIFVWEAGRIERINVSDSGEQADVHAVGPIPRAISGDGRFVVFQSDAATLENGVQDAQLDVFVRDRHRQTTLHLSPDTERGQGFGGLPQISADGRLVTYFGGWCNEQYDCVRRFPSELLVHELELGTTTALEGWREPGAPSIKSGLISLSVDGRYVAMDPSVTTLPSIIVLDTHANTTRSLGHFGDNPSISGDGRFVAFVDRGSHLPDDTMEFFQVYVTDLELGVTYRASSSSDGEPGNGDSGLWGPPRVSLNGRFLVFTSEASNLVCDDTNGLVDVFIAGIPQ
jgi:Tol biopolymer transport system component